MEDLFWSPALKKCKCWRYYYFSKRWYLYPQVIDEVKYHAKVMEWIGMKATAGTSFSQPPIPINGSDFPPLSVSTRVEITSLQVLGTGKIQYLDRLHIYLTSKICSHLQVREQAPSHRWKEKIQCRVVLCYLADLRMESHLIKHCTPVTFHSLSCPVRDSRNSNGHLNAKP